MGKILKINQKIKSFSKKISIEGDKSLSIRWALLASQATGKSKAYKLLKSEDVLSTLNCLIKLGVKLIFSQNINSYDGKNLEMSCMYTGQKSNLKTDSLVTITARLPIDMLYYQVKDLMDAGKANSIKSIYCIGDANAPAPIASAVYAGRKYALEIDEDLKVNHSLRRDTNLV